MATPVTEEPIAKSKKPSNSAFKQQRLPAWQPILTAGTVLPTFFVIGLAFIPIGIGLLVSSNEVQEKEIDYTECTNDKNETCESIIAKNYTIPCTCVKTFDLKEQYKADVFMYYGLTNYYQNHRRYVKSRDDRQLLGRAVGKYKDCNPFDYKQDPNGSTSMKIAPCGAIANSFFNDSFILEYRIEPDGKYENVNLLRTGIAWPTDKKVKFENPPGSTWAERFKDTTFPPNWRKPVYELDEDDQDNNGYKNEDLIVWMRTAALPSFRKLYRKIDHTKDNFRSSLPAGKYRLTVQYNYPVTSFKGTKRMILSNTSWLGGKNPFLGIAYIVVGTICLILAFVFLIIHNKFGRSTHDIVSISQRTPY